MMTHQPQQSKGKRMIIVTKFLQATDTRGERVKATLSGRRRRASDPRDYSVVIGKRYDLDTIGIHLAAAQAVVAAWNRDALAAAESVGQPAEYAQTISGIFRLAGDTVDGRGYVFACPSDWGASFEASSCGDDCLP